MLSAENIVLTDSKKLKKLFRRTNKNTERILHGLVSISYELAPGLQLQYKNENWSALKESIKFIFDIYTNFASKELEEKLKRLMVLTSKQSNNDELSEIILEMEHLSKDVKGDVERFLL